MGFQTLMISARNTPVLINPIKMATVWVMSAMLMQTQLQEAGKERQHPHAEWRSIHRKGSTVAEGSFKGSFKTATPSVGHIFSDGGLTHVGVVEDAR